MEKCRTLVKSIKRSFIGPHYENYASLHFVWKLVQLYNNVHVLITIVAEVPLELELCKAQRRRPLQITKYGISRYH